MPLIFNEYLGESGSQEVDGSIPFSSTKNIKHLASCWALFFIDLVPDCEVKCEVELKLLSQLLTFEVF